ncbi:MAG: hypothetical protein ACPG5U_02065 [Planktomarina sp.]
MELDWDKDKRNATLEERGLDFANVAFLDWEQRSHGMTTDAPIPKRALSQSA